jgi:hypothetical protein
MATREVATLDHMLTGFKKRLETIEGLRATAMEPEQPNFPAAYPRLVDGLSRTDFDGDPECQVDLWVLVSLDAGFLRAQTDIYSYMSAHGRRSLQCALEADPTLNGAVAYCWVESVTAPGRADIGGVACLAGSLRVRVYM